VQPKRAEVSFVPELCEYYGLRAIYDKPPETSLQTPRTNKSTGSARIAGTRRLAPSKTQYPLAIQQTTPNKTLPQPL